MKLPKDIKILKLNTVIVPFKVCDDDSYFLVWTTTPWTLISNVALCVNPNEKYVKVLSNGYKFILAKKLANKVLGDSYEILEEYLRKRFRIYFLRTINSKFESK